VIEPIGLPPPIRKPPAREQIEEKPEPELEPLDLVDTRRMAAERVKAYQKKHFGAKPKPKRPQAVRATEPRIVKQPRPLPQPIVGLPYLRPTAELLHAKPM
jgi:hypothetical protein